MKTVTFPDGRRVPALGQGTWNMGEDPAQRAGEIASLRLGLDHGLTLIDTAEMYADGAAEELVGAAVRGRRDEVFLVSKVYPFNASFEGVQAACDRSLRRLGTDRLDLYLLHWPGAHPLDETIAGFEALCAAGKILGWGVSNFDARGIASVRAAAGGAAVATDQVLYNLATRGIEWELLPAARASGLPVMAYSPVDQGRLARHRKLGALAGDLGVTAAQLALAWVLDRDGVIAIPKAGRSDHVVENAAAAGIPLTDEIRARLDALFPPPTGPTPLDML